MLRRVGRAATRLAPLSTAPDPAPPPHSLPFQEIPSLSTRQLLSIVNPYNQARLAGIYTQFFKEHGDIFKLRFPGSKYYLVCRSGFSLW